MEKFHFKDFLSRYNNDVDDNKLFLVLKGLPSIADGVWLAGGAIRRTLISDPLISDYDFFFNSKEKLEEFAKSLKEKGARETSKTDHQITYTIKIENNDVIVQLIKISYYKNVEDLLDSFDFTITQFAYDGTNLYCGDYSLWDLARRRLALHRVTYGVATMRRMIKYTKQDFTACAGVMQQLLESVASNPSVINSEIQYID